VHGQIILSHGSGSGPDAIKTSALARRAVALGWRTQRPDFRPHDEHGYAASVAPRVAQLRAAIAACDAPPVLAGSSMGAFTSALASLEIPVAGLFLMATPPAIPGVAQALDLRAGVPVMLVHGWRDEVCPMAPVQAFAATRRLPLLLVDDDHRLGASLDLISAQCVALLGRLA
jgi:predicted alpha/beta-hydrolase family hydrolase